MKNIQINQKQAKEFAAGILSDIDEYIKNHQREFEEFLKEEKQTGGKNNGKQ